MIPCPKCGSTDTKKAGYAKRVTGSYQRVYCHSCKTRPITDIPLEENSEPEKTSFDLDDLEDGKVEEGNYIYISGEGNLKTREDVVQAYELDLDEWEFVKFGVSSWTTPMNIHDQPVAFQNHSVKAQLARKVFEPEFQTIRPVESKIRFLHVQKPQRSFKKALIVPDSQNGFWRDVHTEKMTPFHDRRAWSIILQLAKDYQPDTIIFLGDMLDLAEWSGKFVKSPEFVRTTQPTINELHGLFGHLRGTCPHAEMIYLEGNHEIRLRHAIIQNNEASYGLRPADDPDGPDLVSVERILGLQTLHIQYKHPYVTGNSVEGYSEYWLNDNLKVSHGSTVRSKSGQTVTKTIEDARYSWIYGHIHRIEIATKTAFPRNKIVTYQHVSPGTIAKIDGSVPSHKDKENGQQGCAMVDYDEEMFTIQPIYIHDGKAIYQGQLYEGEDYSDQLTLDMRFK
jgi:hypothetical protein